MPVAPGSQRRNLLLIGGDATVRGAAAGAAVQLGAVLHTVPDLPAAIPLLLDPPSTYTHVLAPAALAVADIDTLAALVDEVTAHPTRLLLLGAAEDRGPTELAVPVPNREGIEAAVRAAVPEPPPGEALTEEALRDSLHGGRLRMRFQPVVDAVTHRPLALEALARLHHPALGILRPADFLPLAVASGQERSLTGIAAARAMLELKPLPGLQGFYFAINTPLSSLLHVYAVERAVELCAVVGISSNRVVLEMLETVARPELREMAAAVERWRNAGFNVTIDDAGPRLPHWEKLLDLPFTGVKLDGALAAAAPAAVAFARRITALARSRGLFVVAEGVEDAAAADRLRDLGANALQGFHFSRPLPARAVPVWLARHQGSAAAA